MVCPNCSSRQSVTLRGKVYCLICGRVLPDDRAAAQIKAPVAGDSVHHRPAPITAPVLDIGRPRPAHRPIKGPAEAAPPPVELSLALSSTNQALGRRPLRSISWLITGLLLAAAVIKGGLVVYLLGASDAASRERIFAAAPLTTLAALILWTAIIWLRASLVYSQSHWLDHRPAQPNQALAAAWNVTGRLAGLDILGLLVGLGWSIGLLELVRLLGSTRLAPTVQTGLGIAICLAMTLVLLALAVWYSLSRQTIILGNSHFLGALARAAGLARRSLGGAMALAIWLLVAAIIFLAIPVAVLASPHWLAITQREADLAAAVILIVGLRYLSTLFSISWLAAYRQLVQPGGSHQLAAYLGRRPQPVRVLVIILSLIWWLTVAGVGSYLLWRAHYDPRILLDHLRAIWHS